MTNAIYLHEDQINHYGVPFAVTILLMNGANNVAKEFLYPFYEKVPK